MIRGCTETLTITVGDNSLTLPTADNVFVSIVQGETKIEKNGDALHIDGNTIEVELSQAESLRLRKGTAEVQVNWLVDSYGGRQRVATKPASIDIEKQLLPRVLT